MNSQLSTGPVDNLRTHVDDTRTLVDATVEPLWRTKPIDRPTALLTCGNVVHTLWTENMLAAAVRSPVRHLDVACCFVDNALPRLLEAHFIHTTMHR